MSLSSERLLFWAPYIFNFFLIYSGNVNIWLVGKQYWSLMLACFFSTAPVPGDVFWNSGEYKLVDPIHCLLFCNCRYLYNNWGCLYFERNCIQSLFVASWVSNLCKIVKFHFYLCCQKHWVMCSLPTRINPLLLSGRNLRMNARRNAYSHLRFAWLHAFDGRTMVDLVRQRAEDNTLCHCATLLRQRKDKGNGSLDRPLPPLFVSHLLHAPPPSSHYRWPPSVQFRLCLLPLV